MFSLRACGVKRMVDNKSFYLCSGQPRIAKNDLRDKIYGTKNNIYLIFREYRIMMSSYNFLDLISKFHAPDVVCEQAPSKDIPVVMAVAPAYNHWYFIGYDCFSQSINRIISTFKEKKHGLCCRQWNAFQ